MTEQGPKLDPFDERPLTRDQLLHELSHNGSAHVVLCSETNENNHDASCREQLIREVDTLLEFLDIEPERWSRYVVGASMLRSPETDLTRGDAEVAAYGNNFSCGEWLHRLTWDDMAIQANESGDTAEVHINMWQPRIDIRLQLNGYADCWNQPRTREFGWHMAFTAELGYGKYQSDV